MTKIRGLAFSIDRTAAEPVFEQICSELRSRIASGGLAEGSRLPATRALATDLGVSRSTVVTAYEQLAAEGYLSSLQGSGYSVCALGSIELPAPAAAAGQPQSRMDEAPLPPPRPFAAGYPDMRLFPHRQWAKAVARVCRARPELMLAGGHPFGNFRLRQAIAAHVAEWRGVDASPHQIVVTAGATDGLEICMRSLAASGGIVGIENPGYPPLRTFARSQGLEPVEMPLDGSGAVLPDAADRMGLVILTPSHQYPMGGAMPPGRRMEFISWAERTGGWIIEDDYDSEFRYAGRPIPALAGFDGLNRTIYAGSFSKIFSNAMRLGYLIVPAALTDAVKETIHRYGQKAGSVPQQPLAEFMESGEFYRHLRRVRRIYGERRRHLLDRLAREFAEWGSAKDHQAGMQIVFELKPGLDDRQISAAAYDAGLGAQPLSRFYVGAPERPGLLLGCCHASEEELDAALEVLKRVLEGR